MSISFPFQQNLPRIFKCSYQRWIPVCLCQMCIMNMIFFSFFRKVKHAHISVTCVLIPHLELWSLQTAKWPGLYHPSTYVKASILMDKMDNYSSFWVWMYIFHVAQKDLKYPRISTLTWKSCIVKDFIMIKNSNSGYC